MTDQAQDWFKYYNQNLIYHQDLERLARYLIPADASVIEFGCKGGELLSKLPNKTRVGVESNQEFVDKNRKKYPKIKFYTIEEVFSSTKSLTNKGTFDYIILSHTISEIDDVQQFLNDLKRISHPNTKVITIYFNFLWKPLLDFGEGVSLKYSNPKEPNWFSPQDVDNLFYLESYDKIRSGHRFLFPINIPVVSDLFNTYLSQLPLISNLCLTNYSIFKLSQPKKDYSVSVLVPARNEEGNIHGVLEKIPKLGKGTEVVFVEGHSKDNTYQAILDEIKNYKGPHSTQVFKQKGNGKGDAVRLGFEKAKNEVLMILDADLTVPASELSKFYEAISEDKGDFIMGSRLIYPMDKQAMRVLNYFGNKFFSWAFSFLLDQPIKDTLCGTKVLRKVDYQKIADNRKYFGDFDPFGDYDLIFGAAKQNLKIVEIPIRYKERSYGTTNISRFRHGLLLFKMVGFAARKIKFI